MRRGQRQKPAGRGDNTNDLGNSASHRIASAHTADAEL